MQKKVVVIAASVIVVAAGWYAFRPERLFIDQTVNEQFPGGSMPRTAVAASTVKALYSGRFHGVAHESKGKAEVLQVQDGKRVLRFTEFETSNGPDVQLYLIASPDAKDNATVTNAGFVALGALKGNKGDQNYEVPEGVDFSKYQAVTIWCRRFGVNFGTAPLKPEGSIEFARASQPSVIAQGMFHDGAHKTAGKAAIHNLEDGRRLLRLTEFETSNGPDLQLYLVAASDVKDSDTVKKSGFISLGPLKGNRGDQNYVVPSNVDLARYSSVTVWCRRFGVNFGTAPLMTQQ
jgi:hypothetical protein